MCSLLLVVILLTTSSKFNIMLHSCLKTRRCLIHAYTTYTLPGGCLAFCPCPVHTSGLPVGRTSVQITDRSTFSSFCTYIFFSFFSTVTSEMFHFIPRHCHVHPMKMIFLQLHLWRQQAVIYPSLKTFVWHLSCFPSVLIGWLLFEWIGCGTLRNCCMRTCFMSSTGCCCPPLMRS
jgi:hypothetical protein